MNKNIIEKHIKVIEIDTYKVTYQFANLRIIFDYTKEGGEMPDIKVMATNIDTSKITTLIDYSTDTFNVNVNIKHLIDIIINYLLEES